MCTNYRSVRRAFYNFFTSGEGERFPIELEKINELYAGILGEVHKQNPLFFARAGIQKSQKRRQFWLKNRNKSVTISLQRHFWGGCGKLREQLFVVRKSVVFIWKCLISLMKKLTDDLHFWVRYCIMEAQWKVVPLWSAASRFWSIAACLAAFPRNIS